MKILHTADWQIGMKADHVGTAAEKVRQARLEAARRIRDLARQERVDFVLLAGDTFEDNGISQKLVREVGEILGGFDCDVFVIPGNHDPWSLGSVWEQACGNWRSNVHVLLERESVPIPGGRLFPCPLEDRWSDEDPTEWISPTSEDGIRIGIAHGSLEGIPGDQEVIHPIALDATSRAALDYLALGHWHSVQVWTGAGGAARTAYCGTPEPTSFGERDSGNVLIVEIDAPGSPPRIEQRSVATLQWLQLRQEVRQKGDLEKFVRSLKKQYREPERTLLDVRVAGLLFASECEKLGELRQFVEKHFLFGRLDDGGLYPAPEDECWINDLPEGFLRQAAQKLREKANIGKSPEASQALVELYRLAKEGGE